MSTKQCSKCKEVYDTNMFTSDVSKKDSLYPSCKKCVRKYKVSKGLIKARDILSEEYKRCTKCKKALLKTEFQKDRTKKDGIYSSCKQCRRDSAPKPIKKMSKRKFCSAGYVWGKKGRQHREIMESILGRKLETKEHVHHINGIKTDNRPENLEVISHSDHSRLHYEMHKHKMIPTKRIHACVICTKVFSNMSGKAKYCSPSCRYHAKKDYVKEWVRKNKLSKRN